MTGGGQQEGGDCWFEFPFSYRIGPSGHLRREPGVTAESTLAYKHVSSEGILSSCVLCKIKFDGNEPRSCFYLFTSMFDSWGFRFVVAALESLHNIVRQLLYNEKSCFFDARPQ